MNTPIKNKKGTFQKSPFFIYYLITDPEQYGNTPEIFKKNLIKTLEIHQVDMICFRDKTTKDILPLAKIFLDISQQYKIQRILINSDIDIAIDLGFDGVHLNSQQFDKIKEAKNKNLYTLVSCHHQEEIVDAKKQKADAITYSPIFYKENKGSPKGLEELAQKVAQYQDEDFKIIALGGIIDKTEIEQVKKTDCYGFASIRYFNKFRNDL